MGCVWFVCLGGASQTNISLLIIGEKLTAMEWAAILHIFQGELLGPLAVGALCNCVVCLVLTTTPA